MQVGWRADGAPLQAIDSKKPKRSLKLHFSKQEYHTCRVADSLSTDTG